MEPLNKRLNGTSSTCAIPASSGTRASSSPGPRRWLLSQYQARSRRSTPTESIVPPVSTSATRGSSVMEVLSGTAQCNNAPDMSERLRLTLACGDYDINLGLVQGSAKIAGVDLVALTMPSPERHWRLLRHQEFDVCELSLASYMILRDRGELPYTAIPVFPHRRFRHS